MSEQAKGFSLDVEISDQMAQIKASWRKLIRLSGGYEAAAAFLETSTTTLHRYGDVTRKDVPRIDYVLTLERDIGQPIVTQIICEISKSAEPIDGATVSPLASVSDVVAKAGQTIESLNADTQSLVIAARELRERADRAFLEICAYAKAKRGGDDA